MSHDRVAAITNDDQNENEKVDEKCTRAMVIPAYLIFLDGNMTEFRFILAPSSPTEVDR